MMKTRLLVLLAAVSLPLLPAFAAEQSLPVAVQTANGIKYYNGGVGVRERAEMPQVYPLKLVFATNRGHYLNNADVAISDAAGKEVFRALADNGPWMIIDLPPGSYAVEATLEGRAKKTQVTVSSGSSEVSILRWKTTEVDMGL